MTRITVNTHTSQADVKDDGSKGEGEVGDVDSDLDPLQC